MIDTVTRWRVATYGADVLTAASLVYLLLHLDPASLNTLPGMLLGVGVSLCIAHWVYRIKTLRGAR